LGVETEFPPTEREEKPPRMAVSGNVDGSEEANTKFATGDRLPLSPVQRKVKFFGAARNQLP
jgi:hypothetical protein